MENRNYSINQKIIYLFIIALILSYSINIKIISGLRPLDFICLGLFGILITMRTLKYNVSSVLACIFLSIYFLSMLIGTIFIGVVRFDNFLFTYKYLFAIITLLFLKDLSFKYKYIKNITRVLFIIYMFLCLYVFIHLFLVINGFIDAHLRVSFPFGFLQNESETSDSPLYSSILSLHYIFIFFMIKFKFITVKSNFKKAIIYIFPLISILFTGSRTGLVSLVFTLFLFYLYGFMESVFKPRKKINVVIIFIVIIFIVFGVVLISLNLDKDSDIMSLITRSFKLGLSNDASAQGRIRKMNMAFDSISSFGYLLGVGMQSVVNDWYDSSIGAISAVSGFLGFFIVIVTIFVSIKNDLGKINKKNRIFYLLLCINYIFSNIISEYFLVSRSIVPFTIILLVSKNILKKSEDKYEAIRI